MTPLGPNSLFNFQWLLIYLSFHYIYSISLDEDVLETSKRHAMFYNILSQIFIVKCFTESLFNVLCVINKFHICRKICKTCKCKPEEHDIKSAEEEAHKLVVHSLFSKDSPVAGIRDYFRKLEAANKTERSEYAKQFAWCPPGLQQGVVCISTAEQKVFSVVLEIGNQVEMKSLCTVNQLIFGSKSIGINCHLKSPPPPQKKATKQTLNSVTIFLIMIFTFSFTPK